MHTQLSDSEQKRNWTGSSLAWKWNVHGGRSVHYHSSFSQIDCQQISIRKQLVFISS